MCLVTFSFSQLPRFPQQFIWKYNFQDSISGNGESSLTWDLPAKRSRSDTNFKSRGNKQEFMISRYDLMGCCGSIQWYWRCTWLNACSKRILVGQMRDFQIAGTFRGKTTINGVPVDSYFYKFSSNYLKQETWYWIAQKNGYPYPFRIRRETLPGSHPSNPPRVTVSDTTSFELGTVPESFYKIEESWNCEFVTPEKCKPVSFSLYQNITHNEEYF